MGNMKFPGPNDMTPAQAAANQAAQKTLIPGKHYRFEPPVTAGAIPTGGQGVHGIVDCEFDRGLYLGFRDDRHVFHGKPINDTRPIPNPQLRESYFRVLFTGGSKAIPEAG